MVQFTDAQKKAIEHRGHNILVSASAGSGKTAVLVQRVIETIQTIDVDQLLIVTFTKLAAQEMKDRIRQAVQKQIAQLQQKDVLTEAEKKALQHYRRQINRLNVAQISTIHSFCEQVIHKFYYLDNIDPDFKILEDPAQTVLLRQEVFAAIREDYYNQDDTAFFKLTETFSNDHDDAGLEAAIYQIYDYMRAFADSAQWLHDLVQPYQNYAVTLENPIFKEQALPELKAQTQALIQKVTQYAERLTDMNLDRFAEYYQKYQAPLLLLQKAIATNDYTEIHKVDLDHLGINAPRISPKKEIEVENKDLLNALKKDFRTQLKALAKFKTNYFGLSEVDLQKTNVACQSLLQTLIDVVQRFAQQYQLAKQQRGFLDFSDLEHKAYTLLRYQDAQGQHPVQSFYRMQFKEVLIDEYQDINPLQEALLKTVADQTKGNRFMVGDIKQSIYGFRMADPGLFATKYAHYQDGATAGDERIILADNFRSKKTVTDFVNFIFAQLMTQDLGGIAYDQNAYLHFGAAYYPNDTTPVEVLLTQKDEPKDLTQKVAKSSILKVIQRIQKMIEAQETIYDPELGENRPIKYQDIAILVRSRYANTDLVDAFKQVDIPIVVSDTENYFKTTELQVMLALLQLIDNVDQDIPLVAVLRSPMYQFDENELGYIRGQQQTKDDSFYECLLQVYQQAEQSEVCQADFTARVQQFFADLKVYRDMARNNQISDLIWKIYDRTGFLDYVSGMPSGAQRRANLNALYDRAKQYEQTGFKGIFKFVNFIKQMQKNNKDLAQPNRASTLNDAVQVLTIHGSKGLEFPIVFCLGLEHQFNQKENQGSYLLHQTLGIGLTYLTEDRVKIPTIQRNSVRQSKNVLNLAEELRLLYVAMTRAQQRLILVAELKNPLAETLETWQAAAGEALNLPLTTRLDAQSFLDFVGPALVRGIDQGDFKDYYQKGLFEKLPHNITIDTTTPSIVLSTGKQVAQPQAKKVIQVAPDFTKLVKQRFTTTYPNLAATQTTAYQSVSDIKQQFDDPDLDNMVPLQMNAEVPDKAVTLAQLHEPDFLTKTPSVSPAQIGSATHLVLQKLKLTSTLDEAQVIATIENLVTQKLLAPELADKINIQNILSFFQTSIGSLILAHPENYHREVTFSMVYPAEKLFSKIKANQAGNVLIHGMMDGYYQTENKLILIDYKTDHTSNQKILAAYQGQLNLYALALAQMCQRPVQAKYLFALQNQALIEVI